MNTLKITIEHLKNYLGTGLKFFADDDYSDEYGTILELIELIGLNSFDFIEGRLPDFETVTETFEIEQVQPICYRLSELDKFIPELGFVPLVEIDRIYGTTEHNDSWIREAIECKHFWINSDTDNISFRIIQKLFQWHFWPFGEDYFEKGLVIDKLKLQNE